MYITFEEYQNLGGAVTDAATFSRLLIKSEADVDFVTNNRLKKVENLSELNNLKLLMLELIDNANISYTADKMSQQYGRPVTNISNDGVSIGLSPNVGAQTSFKDTLNERYKLIQRYLPEYSYRGFF